MAAHLRLGRAAAQAQATLTIPLTLRDGAALQAEKQRKIKADKPREHFPLTKAEKHYPDVIK